MALFKNLHKDISEAGVDEAGRGCLAGPVVAAAVILPPDFFHPLLNDSKKLNEKVRYQLREVILKEAITWNVGIISSGRIDEINILRASFEAMHEAIEGLSSTPQHLLIDGNRFVPWKLVPHTCVIGGDGLYTSIAAASVLAKTIRDDLMNELHLLDSRYGWNTNKGYGTVKHVEAIHAFGMNDFHRKSFKVPAQLRLF